VKLKALSGTLLLLLISSAVRQPLRAQTSIPNLFNPISASSQGVHLYGVSVFSGYYTGSGPLLLPVSVQTPLNPGSDVAIGAAASFGWNRSGERSGIAVGYSLSYFGSTRHPEYNTFGHSFSLSAHRQLTNKWSVSASAAAGVTNLEQSFFNPSSLQTVASIPTTFDDLAAAMLTGQFTNSQLASILTATPTLQSPEQAFLYGNRILSTFLGVGFSYSISQRSSFEIGFSAGRSQTLQSSAPSNFTSTVVVPRVISGSMNVGWSYSLSPRTSISASLSSSRSFSTIQSGYGTSAGFSVSRTMSRHWFLQGGLGAGTLLFLRDKLPAPGSIQGTGNGSIGYKTYGHTFLVSYNRSLGDSYGAGSGTTSSLHGSWSWKPGASSWSIFASFGAQHLANPSFHNPTSWQGGAGFAKSLNSHMFVSAQFAYLRYPYSVLPNSVLPNSNRMGSSQEGISVALTWSPSSYR
jgi:hypothetical protein